MHAESYTNSDLCNKACRIYLLNRQAGSPTTPSSIYAEPSPVC